MYDTLGSHGEDGGSRSSFAWGIGCAARTIIERPHLKEKGTGEIMLWQ
jgi:hypothetical protein